MSAPFDDLIVVELASVLAGPSVGQFFAEGGATVLKIENPRTGGDVTRSWHLASEDPDDDRPAYFTAVNWGKRSVALDLTDADARTALHALVQRADVVVSSYRPGQAEALGVDADTLRGLNSRLIIAEVTGYGAGDNRAGYDAVVQAESGFTFLNGEPNGPPVKMPVALVDVLAAHHLKEAILIALLERERKGEGTHVMVSLLGSAVASLANQAANWLTAGVSPQRLGSAHPNIAPYGTLYPCADGAVVLAVGTDRQFRALGETLGLAALADDKRFQTNAARVRHRDALDSALTEATQTWERSALLDALATQGVPAGAVRDLPAVFEQEEANRLVVRDDASRLVAVRTVAFGAPADLSPPPHYGANTRGVLEALAGLSAPEIDALIVRGGAEAR